jgi:hypothetical protein
MKPKEPKMKSLKAMTLSTAILAAFGAHAQLILTVTNYCQNFDGLGGGLPKGWMVCTNAHATNVGTATTFITSSTSWGSQTGQFQNSASTCNGGTNLLGTEISGVQSGFTNRAPAIRQTGSFGDPGAAFVLNLTNTLGMANFQLTVDFLMLSVQTRSNVWTVDYGIGGTPVNFTPLAAYTNSRVFGAMRTKLSFGAALDNKNANVWIRFVALGGSSGTGTRDTFGLDNFSLSWTNLLQPVITTFSLEGGVKIDFTGNGGDIPSSFLLVGSSEVGGAYADTGALITQLGPGQFRANCSLNDSQHFYRVQRR